MDPNNKTAARQAYDEPSNPQDAPQHPFLAAMAGSMMQSPNSTQSSSLSVPQTGSHKILGIFDTAATRRHRAIMEYLTDVTAEAEKAQSMAAFLSDAFLTYNFESEAVAEQLLRQYANNPIVLSVAPTLIQIARQMRIDNMVGINQAGQSALRNKIERR